MAEKLALLRWKSEQGLYQLTAKADPAFLHVDPAQRVQDSFLAWRDGDWWNELWATYVQGDTRASGSLTDLAPPKVIEARQTVLNEIVRRAKGNATWIWLDTISLWLSTRNENFLIDRAVAETQRPTYFSYGPVAVSPYVYNSLDWIWESCRRDEDLGWRSVEDVFVRSVVTEGLYWLGLVDLGYLQPVTPAGGAAPANVVAVRLTVGKLADLPHVIEEHKVQEVIICLPEASHDELVQITAQCERERVGIRIYPDVFQIMASEVSISDLAGMPLLTMRDVALRGWYLALKRGVDVVGSLAALIVLSPLMILMAVLIKLESPGPVFYVQERMGLDAKPFQMLKFRSMRADAERQGPGWTTADDPRRTRIGALLRKLSVDELPQFINVLLGDMSLVGPRPERPVYVEQFRQSIPRYMDRHREKAGLTGWAQVNGLRGDTSITDRTKYDLWYIENWSLSLDFKIMLRTALRVFGDRSAY